MSCDKYLELLSARLDGELTGAEERELEAHLESCPSCRTAGAQLTALRSAFAGLEEIAAPEDLVRDVMDRVRMSGPSKAVPLFRRSGFKALAGLAACALLAVGLYGAVSRARQDAHPAPQGFSRDAVLEEDGSLSAGAIPRSVPDSPEPAAGPDTVTSAGGTEDHLFFEAQQQKAVPDEYEAAVYDSTDAVSGAPASDTEILVVDRMPEGGWELIPPESLVSADGLHVTGELLKQIGKMAQDQGITASLTSGTEEAQQHLIVVLNEAE